MAVDLHDHGDPHDHAGAHPAPEHSATALPACGLISDAQGRPAAVVAGIDVSIAVDGLAVRATWRVRFHHHGATAVDATYLAPLPAGWAVVDAVARFGSRQVRAELAERGAARAVYDAAVAAGLRVGLLEADRREVFTFSLGRLAPGEHPELEIVLVGSLDVDGGIGSVRLPLLVAPRYTRPGASWWGPVAGPPGDPDASRAHAPRDPSVRLPVDVQLLWHGALAAPAANVIGAECREAAVGSDGGDGWSLRWSGGADRDVVVRAPVLGGADRATAAALPDGGHLVRIDLLDAGIAPAAASRDVAIVVDRSGSMQGWKMAAAQRLAARVLDALGAGDRVVVVGFDDAIDCSDPALAVADAPTRRRVGRFIETLDARGGTDLDRAVVRAGTILHADGIGRDKVLVLVTDAQVTAEAATRHAVASVLGDAQLYVIGIDEAVNAGLCRDLAALGGGRFDLVTRTDEVGDAVARVVQRVGRPVARRVRLAEPATARHLPRHGADRYAGAPLTVWAVVAQDPTGTTVVVEAETPAGPRRTALPVVAAADAQLLVQTWAAAELAQLELEADFGDAGAMAAAVSLSLATRVLCRATAFVAVDHDGARVAGGPDPVVQPLGAPSGWAPTPGLLFAAAAPAPGGPVPPPSARPTPTRSAPGRAAALRGRMAKGDGAGRAEAVSAASGAGAGTVTVSAALRRRVRAVLDALRADPAAGAWALRELIEDLDTFAVPGALRAALQRLAAVVQGPGDDTTALMRAISAVEQAVADGAGS